MNKLIALSLVSALGAGAFSADRPSAVAKVDVVGADFKASQVMGEGAWDRAMITGTTPGGKLFYACGEEMSFSLKLEGVKGPLPAGVYFVDWERRGDDGVTEKGREPLPFKDGRFVYRTRSAKPGFVCLEANVVTADGKRVKKNHRWEPRVFFMGGAGAEPERIPMVPEPSDYDAFWKESLDELAAVPIKAELKPVPIADPKVKCYAVRIPCAGPWPVTGYLTMPASASPTNRFPVNGGFRGASEQEQLPPTEAPHDRIALCINPNGYELGRGPDYVKQFFEGLSEKGKGYGMGPQANRNRATSYWKYCALRAIRSVQWLKTLPEWNGCSLYLSGGSQGDWQAYHAAAHVPGVTYIYANGSWGADWGGQEKFGRLRSTYRPSFWNPDMAYFDPIYAARRISCPVRIKFSGLGDYCSTPASLTLLYRNLQGPKCITYVQGSTHGWRPVGQQSQTIDNGIETPESPMRGRVGNGECGNVCGAPSRRHDPQPDAASIVHAALARGERFVKVPRAVYRLATLDLRGVSDVTIDFAGSELQATADGPLVSLVGCTNVSVREAKLVFPNVSDKARTAVSVQTCDACSFERLEVVGATCAFEERASVANEYRGCRVRTEGAGVGFSVRGAGIGPRLLGCAVSGEASSVAIEAAEGANPDVRGLVTDGGSVRLAGTGGRLEDSVFANGCRVEAGAAACRANETHAGDAPVARTDPMAYVRDEVARGQRRVSVPRARYWLTPKPDEAAYLHLARRADVEIDFNGGELVGTVQGTMFTLSDCTNVTVRGVSVDYSDLPFTQAVIERVDADRNWDVRVPAGYPCPRTVELSSDDFWPVQAYGAKTHEPVNYMRFRGGIAIAQTGADTYRITGGQCRTGEVGDIAVWSRVDRTRPHRRGVVNVWTSTGCRIENVDAFAAPNNGCAFAEGLATGNAYVRCRLVRREPETDLFPRVIRRLRSGNHDAFNSRRSPRGPTLDGCVFQYHCDDCVNISGFYVFVLSRTGRALRIADYAQERLRVGDLCQVQTPDGEAPPDARVVRVETAAPLTAEEKAGFARLGLWPGCENNFTAAQTVTLDREIDLPPGSLLAPRGRMGEGFDIRNCTMGHNRARGLLVKASDGILANNTLEGVEDWAILMAPECTWMESGCGSDLHIIGNVCCGNGQGIHIGGRSLTGRPLAASTRRNIRIVGNRIEGGNIAVTGCTGLVVENNDIRPQPGQQPVVCENVEVLR